MCCFPGGCVICSHCTYAVRGGLNGCRFPPDAVWPGLPRATAIWPGVYREVSLAAAFAFENRMFQRRDSAECFPRLDCRGTGHGVRHRDPDGECLGRTPITGRMFETDFLRVFVFELLQTEVEPEFRPDAPAGENEQLALCGDQIPTDTRHQGQQIENRWPTAMTGQRDRLRTPQSASGFQVFARS